MTQEGSRLVGTQTRVKAQSAPCPQTGTNSDHPGVSLCRLGPTLPLGVAPAQPLCWLSSSEDTATPRERGGRHQDVTVEPGTRLPKAKLA